MYMVGCIGFVLYVSWPCSRTEVPICKRRPILSYQVCYFHLRQGTGAKVRPDGDAPVHDVALPIFLVIFKSCHIDQGQVFGGLIFVKNANLGIGSLESAHNR